MNMTRWTRMLALTTALFPAACALQDPPEAEEYKRLNQEVGLAVSNHRTTMDGVGTQEQCQTEQDRYQTEVGPKLSRMRQISQEEDSCGRWGNMGSMCGSQMTEMDRYRAEACGSSDAQQNRQTAYHHCALMQDYTRQQENQADDTGGCGMMGGQGMM